MSLSDRFQFLPTVAVLTAIIIAALYSGHADTEIERICTTHNGTTACRKL